MRLSTVRLLLLTLAVVALLAGCSGDDSESNNDGGDSASTSTEATGDTADDGFDQEAFCEAAGDFGTAQTGAPDAATPEEVEARLTAMSDAADAIVETAPEEITDEAQAFGAAIAAFEQYGADRDYEIDLGGAAPEYQSGEGAAVASEITGTIAAVDQAVQDECDRFLSEAA
jgi:ABC-type glycerol-3-phosphate transport system substrate-binding protein